MTEKWLITGGKGFIGTNLQIFLRSRKENPKIFVLDYLMHKECARNPGAAFRKEDLRSYGPAEVIFKENKLDYVIHLAANTSVVESMKIPRKFVKDNFMSTLNILDLSWRFKVKKFIFASSCAVYGNQFGMLSESSFTYPESAYGTSKLICEKLCESYRREGLPTSILRLSNVYGPWSKHKNSVIHKFIKDGLARKPLTVRGNGVQKRDFLFVHDAIRAIVNAAYGEMSGISCVASGRSISIMELAGMVSELLGGRDIVYVEREKGEIDSIEVDISESRRRLGFYQEMTLSEGLKHTVEWYKNKSWR